MMVKMSQNVIYFLKKYCGYHRKIIIYISISNEVNNYFVVSVSKEKEVYKPI